jgi:hypothetical protein
MRIIKTGSGNYIDQDLKDELTTIFATYNTSIANDKNIFFLKNTTVPRLVTDYLGKNISRVIKKEKADYCIIKHIPVTNFPLYYDIIYNVITKNDNDEVVYSLNGLKGEDIDVIEQIVDFKLRNQPVIYINQDVLNESLNNGFVIDKDNYTTLKELIDSGNTDNQTIAYNMIANSDLSKNWQWVCYLYLEQSQNLAKYDAKDVVKNYFATKGIYVKTTLDKIDTCLDTITDPDVKEKIVQYVQWKFNNQIKVYFLDYLNTSKFNLNDFQISLK